MENQKILCQHAHKCKICGKEYGKTNLSYNGVELWLACDCWPEENQAVFLNAENVTTKSQRQKGMEQTK